MHNITAKNIPLHQFISGGIDFHIEWMAEPQGQANVAHRHDYYEIFIFTKGGGTHIIDFVEYPIQTGSIHFVSAGQVHQVNRSSKSRGYAITFPEGLFAMHHQLSIFHQISLYHNFSEPTLIELKGKEQVEVYRIAAELWKEFERNENLKDELILANLVCLLIHCHRLFLERNKNKQLLKSPKGLLLLQRFRQLLDKHILELQHASEFANLMQVTTGHLNEVVKAQTGMKLTDHIATRLMLEAKRMLMYSNKTIKEISFDLKFEDPAYFGRYFTRKVGMTPGTFRQQIHEKYHT
jgi:AraC-like DNA-binding protein/mannose-6-phosphate isomerase-like protein (cupin superfamily)